MPTPAERQALLFVAAVAALGIGVRAWRAIGAEPADRTARSALAEQISQVDSAIAAGSARRRPGDDAANGSGRGKREVDRAALRDRPTANRPRAGVAAGTGSSGVASPSAPVDVDIASAEELDRLPGIGPALAARIVEDRTRNGPFGSIEGLDRVKGIGPALAERLRGHVTFSLSPRPHDTEGPAVGRAKRARHP